MANGIMVIDKPAGWTSFDVLAKLRGALGTRKLGHAGTLDPMATGVLAVFIGKATSAADRQDQINILLQTQRHPFFRHAPCGVHARLPVGRTAVFLLKGEKLGIVPFHGIDIALHRSAYHTSPPRQKSRLSPP